MKKWSLLIFLHFSISFILSQKVFEKIAPSHSSVNFVNVLDEMEVYFDYNYLGNGSGLGVGDLNNDGLHDLVVASNTNGISIYYNKGDFIFDEKTDLIIGVDSIFQNTYLFGIALVDINQDGWLDMYISNGGKCETRNCNNFLLMNHEGKSFENQINEYGLQNESVSIHSTFFDFDLDGDLDMYLLNTPQTFGDTVTAKLSTQNQFFENVGNNKYILKNTIQDLTRSFSLSASVGDLNNNGFPDMYIANDYEERDYFYENNQGVFQEKLKDNFGKIPWFSMGSDIGDINNDGLQDLMTLDMSSTNNYDTKVFMLGMDISKFRKNVAKGNHYQYMYNALQLNMGNNQFRDIGQLSGVASSDWSWSALFNDYNLDGWQDILISNGYPYETHRDFDRRNSTPDSIEKAKRVAYSFKHNRRDKNQNHLYQNNQDLTFTNVARDSGLDDFTYSFGSVFADLDNDGDEDLIINNINDTLLIYKNQTIEYNHKNYLKTTFIGSKANQQGIGAKVWIYTNENKQVKENFVQRGYLSSRPAELIFGLDTVVLIDSIVCIWAGGNFETIYNVVTNQTLEFDIENAKGNFYQKKTLLKPFLKEVTDSMAIDFIHQENDYDDFVKETLLPHKNSQHGPFTTVGDVNNDGLEDFFVGGAAGQSGEIWLQDKNGFLKSENLSLEKNKGYEDMGALFFDLENDGDLDLYVVSGGNAFDAKSFLYQDRLYINDGKGNFTKETLPRMIASGTHVISTDWDNDGDKDLFVSGRMKPQSYPYSSQSYFLENKEGTLVDVSASKCSELESLGIANAPLFSDFDGDGYEDLIVAGEWSGIRLFKNQKGKSFQEIIVPVLNDKVGWWSSIIDGDFDNDGDLDYIVGNLGLNYKYQASSEEPFQIFANDFDSTGTIDIVLGYYEDGACYPVRGRQCSSEQMPFIKEKFPNYHSFGLANLDEILGEKKEEGLHFSANDFASYYVQNNGDNNFELIPLPIEAQFSSINSMITTDLNDDGFLDVILAGNLYTSEIETPRNDASIGLCLYGKGNGVFKPISLAQSGFEASGDVKNLDWIRLENGKNAILMTTNNDRLRLYKRNNPR